MKLYIILSVLLTMTTVSVLAFDSERADLTAEDLAGYMGVRHKAFVVKNDSAWNAISFCVSIYQQGGLVKVCNAHTFEFQDKQNAEQRFSVIFGQEGDEMRIAVVKNGSSYLSKVVLPESISGFPMQSDDVNFDDEGRLVLAYDVERSDEKRTVITDENRTIEGAKNALVLEIEFR